VNNQKRLKVEFRAQLNKFEEQQKRDEECGKRTDGLMAQHLQTAEEKLRKLKAAMHKPYLIWKWKRSETSTFIPPHEKQCLKIQNRLSPKA
jgi:hypothetical protein